MAAPLNRNHLALAVLVVGKLFGIAGLVVGGSSRVLGGTFLGLDGLLIVTAVVMCLRTMKAREKEDDGHKHALRQMVREGTLKQYLRDLEAEESAKTAAAKSKSTEDESSPVPT